MSKFKVGDIVRCINPGSIEGSNSIYTNQIYKIVKVVSTETYYGTMVQVNNGKSNDIFEYRFVLVEHYDTPLGRILYK